MTQVVATDRGVRPALSRDLEGLFVGNAGGFGLDTDQLVADEEVVGAGRPCRPPGAQVSSLGLLLLKRETARALGRKRCSWLRTCDWLYSDRESPELLRHQTSTHQWHHALAAQSA